MCAGPHQRRPPFRAVFIFSVDGQIAETREMRALTPTPKTLSASQARRRSPGAELLIAGAFAGVGLQVSGHGLVDITPSDFLLLGAVLLAPGYLVVPGTRAVPGRLVLASGVMLASIAALARDLPLNWIITRVIGFAVVWMYLTAAYSFVSDRNRALLVGRLLIVAALLPNLAALAFGERWYQIFPRLARGRLAGAMYDFNSNATLIMVALILCIFEREILSRRLRMVTACTLICLLVLTGSRGAMLAGIVGLTFGFWLLPSRSAAFRPRQLALYLIGGIIVVYTFLTASILSNIGSRPDNVGSRLGLLKESIELFRAFPITGAGFGASIAREGIVVHSSIFGALGEGGLVLAAGLILVLGGTSLRFLRILRYSDRTVGIGFLTAVIGMAVASLTIDATFQRHWWILVGVLAAATMAHLRSSNTVILNTVDMESRYVRRPDSTVDVTEIPDDQ